MTYARCLFICIVCLSLVAGCASFHPKPQENPPWQQRTKVATDGGVTVSVAALTPAETRDELGLRLDRHGIQPVWVKVENNEPIRYYIPPITMDQGYYSPLEAAWKGHGWFSGETNAAIDEHVRAAGVARFRRTRRHGVGVRLHQPRRGPQVRQPGADRGRPCGGAAFRFRGAGPRSRDRLPAGAIGQAPRCRARSGTSTRTSCANGWNSCPAASRAAIERATAIPSTS